MGKFFISYRRDDTQDITGRLYERLAARFGADTIFMDVDSIPIGADFRQVLREAVAESNVALVMIGRQWLTVTDERGQRRLDNPNDFVRIEVEEALASGIPVVPVLTQGAVMPHERDLPPSLSALAYRHGVDVRSDQHFGPDAAQLITRLEPLFPPTYPLPDVPPRLASLGFRGVNPHGTPAILPPLVSVAAGRFLMGSDPRRDPEAMYEQALQGWVEVAAFKIGKYPVTVAEYALGVNAGAVSESPEVAKDTIWHTTWQMQLGRLDHPVVCISWLDAQAYIAWLRDVTGEAGWRLPTEAEWEKAARWDSQANASRIYPWGDSFDQNRCNTMGSKIGHTAPVGAYPASDPHRSGASPWGAEDMAGNVWEWTSSLYQPYPYTQDDGREAPDATGLRALRGGSWNFGADPARAGHRSVNRRDAHSVDNGFRLALSRVSASS